MLSEVTPASGRLVRRPPAGVRGRRYLFIAALLLLASCHREQPAAPPKPRDIILITIDTLRADAPGFAGNARVKTPFLDALAARGVAFNNAHAHNVITLPSHTNILTGLYPFQHGVRENSGFVLDAKHPTIATMLHEAGYATGAFIGAFPLDRRFGLARGFDVYDDNYGKGDASIDFVVQERRAEAVLAAAVKWWSGNEGKKRFMWIHLYDPHAPYAPPEPFATEYRGHEYLGEIAYADNQLQQQLQPILAVDPDALVVVTGDHGEALGDHGELTHGLFAYESTLKIPLVIAGAGIPHRVDDTYARHVDIVPTILEVAGVKTPAGLPGASLVARASGADSYFESLSASLNRGWAPLTGVIHQQLKYIDLPVAELYDLPKDPGEANNLRDEKRREVQEARQLLAPMQVAASSNSSVDPDTIAKLRSLGYLSGSAAAKKQYTAADDPKNLVGLDSKMHQAIDAFERHQPERALQLAKELVDARPDMAVGRETYAFMLQANDRLAEAIHQLEILAKGGGANADDRVRLALLYSETGQSKKALDVLEPLKTSTDPDVMNAFGVSLADEGRVAEAEAAFQRVLQSDPNNAPALQNLGIVALRKDDVRAAQSFLSRALELNQRLPLALNTMGVVYARAGDFPTAVDYWNRAVTVDPRQYDALFNIGVVEVRSGHTAQARKALQQFVSTAPPTRYAADIAAAKKALGQLQ